MLVTVIIPTRNRLEFLKEAVASVFQQDSPDWEAIIVDDASEDGTWDWLSSLKDRRIRTYRLLQHGERSAARNFGLRNASGEFILYLDDDDRLTPNALRVLADGIRRCPTATAVVGDRIYFEPDGRRYTYPHPGRAMVRKVWREVLFGWAPQVSQCIIRKNAIVEAGAWNSSMTYAEDYELWLRMVSSESIFVILPEIVAEYRVHPGQTVPRRVRLRSVRTAFLERLPARLRGRATRTFRAARLTRLASLLLVRRRPAAACRFYAGAAMESPGILISPLVGHRLTRGFGKSLLASILGPTSKTVIRWVKLPFRSPALSGADQRKMG
jgi:glycosyltransferase involved in cell wall biosynthesis